VIGEEVLRPAEALGKKPPQASAGHFRLGTIETLHRSLRDAPDKVCRRAWRCPSNPAPPPPRRRARPSAPSREGRVAFPFFEIDATHSFPTGYPFPASLCKYGDHVRERRLALGWTQERTATFFGVSEDTVIDWEGGRLEPKASRIPRIEEFLGYSPGLDRYRPAELVRRIRSLSGASLTDLAKMAGVCPDTLANLARGRNQPSRRTYERLTALAASLKALKTSDAPETKHRRPARRGRCPTARRSRPPVLRESGHPRLQPAARRVGGARGLPQEVRQLA
jgi:transcriptional regulator with XRE-family HTH domain